MIFLSFFRFLIFETNLKLIYNQFFFLRDFVRILKYFHCLEKIKKYGGKKF